MSYLPRTLPRTNLHTWLDATGLVNNTTNAYGICSGGTCSQLSDISGNGRHFVQATGANQPTLGTGLSSRVSLDFDGGDYLVNATKADWVFLHSTQFSIYVVLKMGIAANPNVQYGIFGNTANTSSSIGISLFYDDLTASSRNNSLGFQGFKGDSISSIGNTIFYNEFVAANTYQLIAVTGDWTSTTNCFSLFGLGTLCTGGKSTRRTTPSGSNSTYDMQIGAVGNNSIPLSGGIHEIAIYNARHTIDDFSKASAYFQSKYAIS